MSKDLLQEKKDSYILLPDQVGRIKNRIRLLKENDIKGSNKQEIQRLENVLNNYSSAHINHESIGIGTCFTVTEIYLGRARTFKYQLVDFLETLNNHFDETGKYRRVCLDTPIGKAVYGKKVGEPFSYEISQLCTMTDGKLYTIDIHIIGTIEDIKSPTKEASKQF